MNSPTGRLNAFQPNVQMIPVRSELGDAVRGAWLPGELNMIIGGPGSREEPQLANPLELGFTEKSGTAHIVETGTRRLGIKAICGQWLDQAWLFPQAYWPKICKHCWKKYQKTLAHNETLSQD